MTWLRNLPSAPRDHLNLSRWSWLAQLRRASQLRFAALDDRPRLCVAIVDIRDTAIPSNPTRYRVSVREGDEGFCGSPLNRLTAFGFLPLLFWRYFYARTYSFDYSSFMTVFFYNIPTLASSS